MAGALYGFGRDLAAPLVKIARREGLRSRTRSELVYPDWIAEAPPEVVQVWKSSGSPVAGQSVAPNASGYHEGFLRRWVDSGMLTLDPVWIRIVEYHDANNGQVSANHKQFYLGRLAGGATVIGDTRPVYLCCLGGTPETGVPFRNDDSENAPIGAIMQINDNLEIAGVEHLLIEQPSTTFHRRYLVNTSGAEVEPEETALGSWLDEDGLAAYDDADGTPAHGEEWGAWPGTWLLRKGRLGFTIYGDGDEVTAGLVRASQREITELFGRTYETLAQGSTAEFEPWMEIGGTLAVTDFVPIEAHDFYFNDSESLDSPRKARIHWYGGKWRYANIYCAVDNVTEE